MGNLSNLYISQSFQSLIHLATNNTASAALIGLEDGYGNPIGISVNTGGDLYLSGSISASLSEGKMLVGDSSNRIKAINTASFATTGSNVFIGNQVIAGNITAISGTFQYLHTVFETASVIYSSGSNQFGDAADDVQTLYGSVRVVNELTASGLNYPTADNGDKSFMQTDGNGNLSFQYVDTIWEQFRAGESVPKGTPLYFSGSLGANPIAYAADAANPNKMPVILIAGDNYTAGNTYEGIVLGLIEGIDLTGYTAGQTVYVAEGGGWTTNLPSGSNSITQVLGIVTKGGNGGKGLVLNPGPAQLPGLQTGYAWVGNGNNRAVAVSTSSFASVINTGSFATTGSNTFVGNQDIVNGANLNVSGNISLTGNTSRLQWANGTYMIGNPGDSFSANSDGAGQQWEVGDSSVSPSAYQMRFKNSTPGGAIILESINGGDVSISGSNTTIQGVNFIPFSQSVDSRLDTLESTVVTNSQTGSFLLTASFDNGTRNLTFTKANGATFNVNIPDASGSAFDSGSYVTTSSFNSYTGSTDSRLNNIEAATSSYAISASVAAVDAAQQAQINSLIAATSSYAISSSVAAVDAAQQAQIDSLIAATSSYADSASFAASQLVQDNRLNNLEAATSSYATDIELAAATGALENSIATKLNTASFNQFTQSYYQDSASFDLRIDNLEAFSSSLDLTFVTQTELAAATGALENSIATKLDTASFNSYTQSTDNRLNNLESTSASVNISISNLNTYTASNDIKWNTLGTLTGSYATTGSNNFRGAQQIRNVADTSAANNGVILTAHSGSLILTNNSFTTGSYGYISASNAGQTNIIMQQNSVSPDFILSGSFNIISMPAAPTAGFKRFIGIGNIALGGSNIPLLSGSMAFPITFNQNYFSGPAQTITMRGPVSSSAWTISANNMLGPVNIGTAAATHAQSLANGFTMTSNQINGTLNIIANQSYNFRSAAAVAGNFIGGIATLSMTGSALQFNNNIVNDTNTNIINGYYSGSVGTGTFLLNRNNLAGNNQTMFVSGAFPAGATFNAPIYNDNAMFGGDNTIFTNISAAPITGSRALHSAIRTILAGHQLIITGSSNTALADTYGSLFAGRWNANDGVRNRSGQNVFVVGTGKNNTERKTGFLIDSGSNTFVEGTFNVSGSSTLSGSLYIQSGSTLPVSTGSAILTWDATTGQVKQAGFSTIVSSSVSSAEFWSTTTQSGSAGVSGSVTFNNSGSAYNVSLVNGTQLTVANAGVYNIQFSAQIETSAGADTVYLWYKKNGTNIPDSATKAVLANNTAQVMTVNILDEAQANDYYEIAYQTLNGNATVLAEAASGNIPAISSVIATIFQIR